MKCLHASGFTFFSACLLANKLDTEKCTSCDDLYISKLVVLNIYKWNLVFCYSNWPQDTYEGGGKNFHLCSRWLIRGLYWSRRGKTFVFLAGKGGWNAV